MALTVRQSKFVGEFLKNRDGKKSAIAAGYSANGAAVQASMLLRHPAVRAALRKSDASVVDRLNSINDQQVNKSQAVINNAEVSVVRVLQEACRLAYLDPGQFYDDDGRLLPIKDIPEDARRAIQGIKLTEFGPEYRFGSKFQALDLLARHLGMVKPPNVQSAPFFSINIHTSPRGAEPCRTDHRPSRGFEYAHDAPGSASNVQPESPIVDDRFDDGRSVILTPERKP